jgi:AcrR family transcriptional regulator
MIDSQKLSKRERTRKAIIDAAFNIIADKGLFNTSIDELMNEAGMARGTFYNYFQTRDEVLQAVVEELRTHLHEHIETRIADNLEPETVIACMMYGIVQYSLDKPCLGWVLVRLGGDNDWFSPYEIESAQFPRADAALLSLVKRDFPFIVIHTYIEGAVNHLLRRLLSEHIDIQRAEQLMVLILRGIGANEQRIDSAIDQAREFAASIKQKK